MIRRGWLRHRQGLPPWPGVALVLLLGLHRRELARAEAAALAEAAREAKAARLMLLRSLDAFDALARLLQGRRPDIMLTGGASEVDRVLSLEFGADDHVSTSASLRELLARITAGLRRAGPRLPTGGTGWRIDEARRDVMRPDGQPCGLTGAEFRVLGVIADRTGQVVPRGVLFQQALDRPRRADDRPGDVLVAKLRRKPPGQHGSCRSAAMATGSSGSAGPDPTSPGPGPSPRIPRRHRASPWPRARAILPRMIAIPQACHGRRAGGPAGARPG